MEAKTRQLSRPSVATPNVYRCFTLRVYPDELTMLEVAQKSRDNADHSAYNMCPDSDRPSPTNAAEAMVQPPLLTEQRGSLTTCLSC